MNGYTKVYSGREVDVLAVKNVLESEGLDYITRDDIHSGIVAGFGTADRAIHIWVEERNSQKALKLIDGINYNEKSV